MPRTKWAEEGKDQSQYQQIKSTLLCEGGLAPSDIFLDTLSPKSQSFSYTK
jgi:hypothetical protein